MATGTGEAPQTWLTQEAYDRLKAERDRLSGEGRVEIARKIEAAREEGDLKENGGYHAAKEEQGKQEARIRQLEQLLRTAKVGEAPTAEGVAGPGMVVEVRFAGDDEPERFLIGSREDSASGDLEIYSAQSPLGRALTGKKVGETASYETPNGRTMTVELLSASPYTG
jgi:transcription elongation factor GreA